MLEVRGRRSGRVISFPVVIADYGGERDLVAMGYMPLSSSWAAAAGPGLYKLWP